MENIEFNGKQISNWLEYFELKFADDSIFNLETNFCDEDELDIGTVTIFSIKNTTKICFELTDILTLNYVYFTSRYGKGTSGGLLGYAKMTGKFNIENFKSLEKLLDIPIYKGWKSSEYFLFGEFYQSKTVYELELKDNPIINVEKNEGCLTLLLFPIFIVIDFFVNKEIIGKKIDKDYKPIIIKNAQ